MKNKYGPWVTGEEFFNRDAEIALLNHNINSGGNHLLIVAPRRVGKTSLIRETLFYHLWIYRAGTNFEKI